MKLVSMPTGFDNVGENRESAIRGKPLSPEGKKALGKYLESIGQITGLKSAFQKGLGRSEIKTSKQAVMHALVHATIFAIALFSPFGILGKIAVFILLSLVVGAIASR
jgi:hypothetical protein